MRCCASSRSPHAGPFFKQIERLVDGLALRDAHRDLNHELLDRVVRGAELGAVLHAHQVLHDAPRGVERLGDGRREPRRCSPRSASPRVPSASRSPSSRLTKRANRRLDVLGRDGVEARQGFVRRRGEEGVTGGSWAVVTAGIVAGVTGVSRGRTPGGWAGSAMLLHCTLESTKGPHVPRANCASTLAVAAPRHRAGRRRRHRETAAGGVRTALATRHSIDKSKVDLKEHRLEVKMNHVASKVTLKVYDDTGAVLADQEQDFSGRAPGTTLVVTWSPSSDAAVGKIEVFAYDKDGYYKGIAITPWAVSIPHEEVNFRRDSADIDDSEKPKLEASLGQGQRGFSLQRSRENHALHRRSHRHRRRRCLQRAAFAGPRAIDRFVVSPSRPQDRDRLRRLRRVSSAHQDARRDRRAQESSRRLHSRGR